MARKRIGILGGISHESTIKYYELLTRKYFEKFGDYYYPEIVIFSLDFQKFTDLENSGDKEGYITYIMEGIDSLQGAGVDFIVMAANSPHAVFPEVQKRAKVPMLSIVEITAQAAKKAGVKKALLLGIKFTMQSSFYSETFRKLDMEMLVPKESEQDIVNNIIFQELVVGAIKDESRRKLLEIIGEYDADAVILGCTELPLLLSQKDMDKKVFNPLELHVQAALEYSLNT